MTVVATVPEVALDMAEELFSWRVNWSGVCGVSLRWSVPSSIWVGTDRAWRSRLHCGIAVGAGFGWIRVDLC